MHAYQATVSWTRDGQTFTDNRYSRGHEWSFDGGAKVAASSSPSIVPLPMSVAANVDPEEALVAAASSCHMLFFLSFAARAGYVVDSYVDRAEGFMDRNAGGKMAMTRIVLRPEIRFGGERVPDRAELDRLHHRSHEECFIANSLTCAIVVEGS
ncbi:OsmC family protein [Noviherbaspirillum aridicola]|uniref:Peroxiredoxin n=1 Tax=Noviherbaspirillum aridicola TaxID=2849687 RepID=A0ABQ4Q9I1_9BURK|nr:OsmC family protein [Noviherbaspirillum aridicola]GIZ53818.1 peroxiredoxin [Noviherbaspirillum aridicola]